MVVGRLYLKKVYSIDVGDALPAAVPVRASIIGG